MSSPEYADEKQKPLGYAEGLDTDSERASFTELIAEGQLHQDLGSGAFRLPRG